jgi:hypothetical protein
LCHKLSRTSREFPSNPCGGEHERHPHLARPAEEVAGSYCHRHLGSIRHNPSSLQSCRDHPSNTWADAETWLTHKSAKQIAKTGQIAKIASARLRSKSARKQALNARNVATPRASQAWQQSVS